MKVKPADRTLSVQEYYFSTKLKQIDEMLAQSVESASVRKGALSSLCQLIKASPLCEGDRALIETKMKCIDA